MRKVGGENNIIPNFFKSLHRYRGENSGREPGRGPPLWVFNTRLEFVAEDRSGSLNPLSPIHAESPGIST